MKTTLEIATELGIEKHTVAWVITSNKIKPVHQECRKNYFSDQQVNQIKEILRFELKIPLTEPKKEIINTEYYEEVYHVYESKMNYEPSTIS